MLKLQRQRPKNYPLSKIKAPDVLDRTKVSCGQRKKIQVSSKSDKVVTLEKVLEQLVSGIYDYDIAVMDNVNRIQQSLFELNYRKFEMMTEK